MRCAIGIDLGGTKVRAGLVRDDGLVLRATDEATDRGGAAAIVAQLVRVATALAGDDDVTGVGVGVPGTVDRATGTLVQAVNLDLHDVPLRNLLGEALPGPVQVENDGGCAALGEHRFGAAAGTSDSVMLTLGTGVGGGIVAAGRLYAGATGTGAELGHIVIVRDGLPCQGSCPGHGHLEAYCSGTALAARGREAGFADAAEVLHAAGSGDDAALALVDDLARSLGAGLVTLANALGPQVIVVGGGLGEAASALILPRATAILRAEALPPNGDASVRPALLGNDAGMIGAACLALA